MSKKSFYCWYLGFTEAYGLQGQNRVHEVIQNILKYYQNGSKPNKTKNDVENNLNNLISPSKVTLVLNEAHVTIIDNSVVSQKKNLFKKQNQQIVNKSYAIGYEDITYVYRLTNQPYSDIVTFIAKSSNIDNQNLKSSLYLHAFRCDSDETAVKMEKYLIQNSKAYWKKLNKDEAKNKKKNPNTEFVKSNHNNNNNNKVKKLANDRSVSPPSESSHLLNNNIKYSYLNRDNIAKSYDLTNRNFYDNSSGGTQSSSSNDLLNSTNDFSTSTNIYHNAPAIDYQNQDINIAKKGRPTSPFSYLNRPIEFENINKEITYKLNSDKPILFPPKDYTKEDRMRGNLREAKFRRSQNPSIVGQEALRQKSLMHSKTNDDMSDLTSSSSFHEQAFEAIKLLDDVVDSEFIKPDYEDIETNIYEFKPPAIKSDAIINNKTLEQNNAYRSASFRNNFDSSDYGNLRNYSNISASLENIHKAKYGDLDKNKSTSMASGLNDPYALNLKNNVVKTNPFYAIEEEPYTENDNDNNRKNSTKRVNEFINSSSSNQVILASKGFRSGALPILSNYHPQWLSTTALSEISNSDEFSMPKNQNLEKQKSFNYNNNMKNIKLKYTESAKVNNYSNINNQPVFNNNNNNNNNNNLQRGKSFQKIGLSKVKEENNAYIDDENSEFILKPASYSANEARFLDTVKPSHMQDKKYIKPNKMNYKPNNNNNNKSEPSLLINNINPIKYNDIYY